MSCSESSGYNSMQIYSGLNKYLSLLCGDCKVIISRKIKPPVRFSFSSLNALLWCRSPCLQIHGCSRRPPWTFCWISVFWHNPLFLQTAVTRSHQAIVLLLWGKWDFVPCCHPPQLIPPWHFKAPLYPSVFVYLLLAIYLYNNPFFFPFIGVKILVSLFIVFHQGFWCLYTTR